MADVCILGGGPTGLSLALSLLHRIPRLSLALVDAGSLLTSSPNGISNRVVSLNPSSIAFLNQTGAWSNIPPHRISPVSRIQVLDGLSGSHVTFNSPDKPMATIIENPILHHALATQLSTVKESNVQLFPNTKVKEIARDPQSGFPVLSFDNGSLLKTRLLIGADGGVSQVRDFAKVDSIGWDYAQRAIVATLKVSQDAVEETAWQRFLPTGPVALLPLSTEVASLVWTLPQDMASKLLKMDETSFTALLNAALDCSIPDVDYLFSQISHDGSIPADFNSEIQWARSRIPKDETLPIPPRILELFPHSRAAFPLRLRQAEYYGAHRIALVGDAAHTVHPLAGQGLNMGLMDAQALSLVLENAVATGRDLGADDVVQEYTEQRVSPNLGLLFTVDMLKRVFASRSSWMSRARSVGMSAVDQSSVLKQWMMKVMG